MSGQTLLPVARLLSMLTDAQLLEAAQRFGTPLYVYSAPELDDALTRVQTAFADARIFYAMKANPNLTLLRRMRSQGVGFECVSAGELSRAVKVGAGGGDILVNGPAKSAEEYAEGARLGATFIVDRGEEVALLAPRSRALVRVNPALKVSTHDHLATGAASSKFGVPLSEVPQVLEALTRAGHRALGLHVHIGSAIQNAQRFRRRLRTAGRAEAAMGQLEVLDVGGGWSLDADLRGIAREAWQAAANFRGAAVGRAGPLPGGARGQLLTRVVGTKRTGRDFVLVDAGMTELLRPMLYGAVHPVRALWRARRGGDV